MTMHRAKGMEFSRVLIFGASEDLLPAGYLLQNAAPEDRDDLVQRERSLFYVAATRARDELVVMWHGTRSPFLPKAEAEAEANANANASAETPTHAGANPGGQHGI